MANYLRKRLGIHGVKAALLYELAPPGSLNSAQALAVIVKRLPQTLRQVRPLDEAISTSGGVSLNAINAQLMLKQLPGVFCAGEMLAWDAPTGGYLLTACMASGLVAGQGAVGYLKGL
jgi:predicted flavoprotein YhiN